MSYFVTYVTVTCDITPLLLSEFKIKKREKETQNKIKKNEIKKIKPKEKYNRVQSIIHNSEITLLLRFFL